MARLESVPTITVDDLKDYTRRVLARANLKIAVVGDIDAETVKAMLDRVFGALPAEPELKPVANVSPQGLGRRIVVKLDVPQAVVTFGGPGIARKDPDFMAAYIVNHILGGGAFSSRLYQEVREKRGLAYSVYDSLVWLNHTALFLGGTATRADRAGETLDLIDKEIRRLAESGPTADELAKAKAYLNGSFALNLDTSSKIAALLVQLQLDGLGIDYFTRRPEMINAVTLDDARRVAKRLLDGGLLVTVAGRPEGCFDQRRLSCVRLLGRRGERYVLRSRHDPRQRPYQHRRTRNRRKLRPRFGAGRAERQQARRPRSSFALTCGVAVAAGGRARRGLSSSPAPGSRATAFWSSPRKVIAPRGATARTRSTALSTHSPCSDRAAVSGGRPSRPRHRASAASKPKNTAPASNCLRHAKPAFD